MWTGLPVINYYNLISQWEIKIGKINMVERNTFFFFFFLVNSCVHSEYFCKSKKMCFDCIQTFLCFLSVSELANKCSDCNVHEEGKSQRIV